MLGTLVACLIAEIFDTLAIHKLLGILTGFGVFFVGCLLALPAEGIVFLERDGEVAYVVGAAFVLPGTYEVYYPGNLEFDDVAVVDLTDGTQLRWNVKVKLELIADKTWLRKLVNQEGFNFQEWQEKVKVTALQEIQTYLQTTQLSQAQSSFSIMHLDWQGFGRMVRLGYVIRKVELFELRIISPGG